VAQCLEGLGPLAKKIHGHFIFSPGVYMKNIFVLLFLLGEGGERCWGLKDRIAGCTESGPELPL